MKKLLLTGIAALLVLSASAATDEIDHFVMAITAAKAMVRHNRTYLSAIEWSERNISI